jgi:putative membrane protein
MAEEQVLWDAEFNSRVTTYWLLGGALALAVTIFGIVLLPFWFFFGGVVTQRYLKSFRCTLTNRSLKVAKGVWVRVEKTIPLDRITDIGLVQGPVMRYFDIEALSVETAGQSSQGSLVQLAGIKDGRKFRDAVLKQRDLVVGSAEDRSASATTATAASNFSAEGSTELLTSIRDTLLRIEQKLDSSERK